MEWLIFIGGLFCLLVVVGYIFSKSPYAFATHSMVLLVALAFVAMVIFALVIIPAENKAYQQESKIRATQTDAFPFSNGDAQYSWYDRHDVPMSDRCYPDMNPPCTPEEWRRAIGIAMSQEEVEKAKWNW